jgi:hypothetical protein
MNFFEMLPFQVTQHSQKLRPVSTKTKTMPFGVIDKMSVFFGGKKHKIVSTKKNANDFC